MQFNRVCLIWQYRCTYELSPEVNKKIRSLDFIMNLNLVIQMEVLDIECRNDLKLANNESIVSGAEFLQGSQVNTIAEESNCPITE
ncbi:hypothetical protein Mal35_41150 [Gimesia maris]|nr:hypothetical protein Mal35_41150 [Gimesia maris]